MVMQRMPVGWFLKVTDVNNWCVSADMHTHMCENTSKLITEDMCKMQHHISILYTLSSSF